MFFGPSYKLHLVETLEARAKLYYETLWVEKKQFLNSTVNFRSIRTLKGPKDLSELVNVRIIESCPKNSTRN